MNLLGQRTVLHNKVVCLAIIRNNPCPTTLSVTLHDELKTLRNRYKYHF